jgi:YebC/PmpR family DNA-binding regulatory protein
MSGHSKWSTIKRKKGALDAKRGKLFSKLIKEITVAARMGGPDPESNLRLKAAISKAKAGNMPNDNIDRAVKRGSGEEGADSYEEITYEGYGPGGVAIYIETLTDNRNRTTADVRHIFSKGNGDLGRDGCVAYLFSRKGHFLIDKSKIDEDKLMEIALEAGAEDYGEDGTFWEITCEASDFGAVRDAIEAAGIEPDEAELTMVPQSQVKVEGKEAEQVIRLMEQFEDNDDIQGVYSNFDIDEDVMEQLSF